VAVERFTEPLVEAGRIVSLALVLLKLTAPGVPDIYQGTELWDLSLVDPDNRRPVDFARRRRLLAEVARAGPGEVLARMDEGAPKLWLIRRALDVRRRRPRAFGPGPAGAYTPLEPQGERAKHVVAFARGAGEGEVVTVVPRLVLGLGLRASPMATAATASGSGSGRGGGFGGGGGRDLHARASPQPVSRNAVFVRTALPLPRGRWRDALGGAEHEGGGPVAVGDLLSRFPVALLERVP
jgi:(1->4)-alpha-D-glucan 1-alpha-D-glucosylmutase